MMEGDLFLENYTGQTVDELIDLAQTYRIDSLVLAFESAIEARKDSGKALSEAEMVVLSVEALEREVNNGGYSQFFYNSSAEYAPYIVRSLCLIGCEDMAALTQQAIDCLGLESLDPEAIEQRMDPDDEQLEQKLGLLDDKYYATDNGIAYSLFDYIKENRRNISLE